MSLLKVLYSNSCRKDCLYCANRNSADIPRTSFTPEELVKITLSFYRRNYIEGLFLSSGVFADPDIVMEKLILVARILREREHFGGYIHLKAIPGCGDTLLKKAGRYADRLSANIELPTASSLALLAPEKSGQEILGAMRFMGEREAESKEELRRPRFRSSAAPRFAPAGQSTQLVIGASPDDDRTIVRLAGALYSRLGLRRVYYSAFIPVSSDPRLPQLLKPPLLREHRLYQADWLLRFYGFKVEELLGEDEANLPADLDPKAAWALRHPEFFPLDLERAEYAELLRVPGVGVRGAGRIVTTRKSGAVRPEDLSRMGIVMKRAAWFLSSQGRPLHTFAHSPSALPPFPGSSSPDPLWLRAFLADPHAGEGGAQVFPAGARPQLEFSFS